MRIIYLFILFISVSSLYSQERYLTQFYGAPITLDPSLTGNFEGNYRVNMAYRNQWSKNFEKPFSTFTGSVDLNFDLGLKNKRVHDIASAGLYFAHDKAGILDFGNTEMGFSGAYHKALGPNQFLSGGLYLSLNQRNSNFTNVTFEDQFNGEDGYTAPTAELLAENNFSYFDQGIGVNYANYQVNQHGFNVGASIAHLSRPEASFYKRDPNSDETTPSFRLPMKYTLHAGGRIILDDFTSIHPRFMYQRQGIQDMATLGANLKVDVYFVSVHMGVFGRAAGVNNKYNFDSAGLLFGVEISNWQVGASYDIGIPSIINYSRNQGTFELTVSYFGLYVNDDLLCPTF
ncbi:MAG: PorP/SprF family type IX secretion system membrane protein [Saprospiraceae bacterium]